MQAPKPKFDDDPTRYMKASDCHALHREAIQDSDQRYLLKWQFFAYTISGAFALVALLAIPILGSMKKQGGIDTTIADNKYKIEQIQVELKEQGKELSEVKSMVKMLLEIAKEGRRGVPR